MIIIIYNTIRFAVLGVFLCMIKDTYIHIRAKRANFSLFSNKEILRNGIENKKQNFFFMNYINMMNPKNPFIILYVNALLFPPPPPTTTTTKT
jgi:hypothetical protein